jgi:hypothetical protein
MLEKKSSSRGCLYQLVVQNFKSYAGAPPPPSTAGAAGAAARSLPRAGPAGPVPPSPPLSSLESSSSSLTADSDAPRTVTVPAAAAGAATSDSRAPPHSILQPRRGHQELEAYLAGEHQ